MKNEILIKIIFLFGGSLLLAITLKLLTSLYFNYSSIEFNLPSFANIVKSDDKDVIYFPLNEQYGLTFKNTKSCKMDANALLIEKGYEYDMNSNCWNASCTVNIAFSEKIPTELSLYVSEGNDCLLKKFKVEEYLKVVGYVVNLQLTQIQKDKLLIGNNDEVRLAQSTGYSLSNKNQFYFYKMKLLEDDILVNNQKKGKVYFTNKGNLEIASNKITDNDIKIQVPHPKQLFTYTCDNNRRCEKKANSYIMNLDGLDFIPEDEFIINCMKDNSSSNHCNKMITIGDITTPKFNSDTQMNHYIKGTLNPEFNDSLEEWEKNRFIKVKEKLIKSMN